MPNVTRSAPRNVATGAPPAPKKNAVVDVFARGEGPPVDKFNAAKDWMSDRLFNGGKPKGAPEKLTGPQRVAYGPLA
ncbi:MAG: hypothetical protein ACK4N5_16020, partial [Myxococcales bacterium]